jgi:hypothetical protein
MGAGRAVQIAQNGHDVVIELALSAVPKTVVSFNVCSAHLIASSSFFRALFAPGRFFEGIGFHKHCSSNKMHPFSVSLRDDDPAALELVLWMMHNEHDILPNSIPFDYLVSLAEVANKYDASHIARRNVESRWFPKCIETVLTRENYLDALFVAWVFKLGEHFKVITFALIIVMHKPGEMKASFGRIPTRMLCNCSTHTPNQYRSYRPALPVIYLIADLRIPDSIIRKFLIKTRTNQPCNTMADLSLSVNSVCLIHKYDIFIRNLHDGSTEWNYYKTVNRNQCRRGDLLCIREPKNSDAQKENYETLGPIEIDWKPTFEGRHKHPYSMSGSDETLPPLPKSLDSLRGWLSMKLKATQGLDLNSFIPSENRKLMCWKDISGQYE